MPETVIETSQLTRRFGALTAVNQLDLRVPAGSIYGFLGPNGAGKTTTIRMLLGLIRPDAGEVRLFGASLKRERLRLLERVGTLVEMPSLYAHLTGYENLQVTQRLTGASRTQIGRALAMVNLEDAAKRLVREYSLGMKHRLGLALALLNEPDLLILDEPTNGLDPAGIHEVRGFIRRLSAEHGVTVFLSSHLLTEVEQMATHIGIMDKGSLLFHGTLDALQSQLQETLVLEVDQPDIAMRLLAEAGVAAQAAYDHRLVVSTGTHANAGQINALLVHQGLEVRHLALERPSLEDVFLRLTGDPQEART